ncbi:hypothetical protein SAY86_016638 [Trapa natans]|uniref:TIR domain-containing protein n=1 Tax=Trapa natans TaxID=22666 RepID=A0AAN7QZN5_TRANT|nr:hypothetical protein SAY86_016638 [Trapa natans]
MAAIEELTDSGSFTREGWEVFLSFRGSDTRRSFISHLASCLKGRGINVFIDYDLRRGNPISKQLMGIIRSSRVSVVVFSRNYGQSRWCLQELCEIMKCSKMLPGRVVLPVFYNVTPNDVRRQGGQFGEEFYKYKDDRNFARWKDALTEAADLSGWDVSDPANGPEAEISRKIADRICKELDNTGYRDVGKYPVGLEHRINQVLSITGCSKISSLPDDIGLLESLVELLADGAPIAKLPLSLGNLKNLKKLYLHGYDRWKSRSISELFWPFAESLGQFLYIPWSNIPEYFEYQSRGTSLTFQVSPCGIDKIVVSFVLSSTKRQPAVPSCLPSVFLYSITSGQQLEADSFSEESIRTEDQLGVLYFKPSLMMDIQQSAAITTQVTLQIEPVADWVIKGVGVHLEEKKRPRCPIIDLDEPEPDSERAGPSHGGSSEEYLPEDELTMEISGGDHRWTLLLLNEI